MQHTIHVLHTQGHYDFLEKTSEKETWTSPRHSSWRVAQRERRERTPSPPPPLMSASESSDGDSELGGEAAKHQFNRMDADLDDDDEVPEEEEDPNSEKEEE